MFGALGDIANLLKNARGIQEKMKTVQDELAKSVFEGEAGNGAVVVQMNGKSEILAVRIRPDAASDLPRLEGYVRDAVAITLKKVHEELAARMSEVTGGLNLGSLTNMLKPGG